MLLICTDWYLYSTIRINSSLFSLFISFQQWDLVSPIIYQPCTYLFNPSISFRICKHILHFHLFLILIDGTFIYSILEFYLVWQLLSFISSLERLRHLLLHSYYKNFSFPLYLYIQSIWILLHVTQNAGMTFILKWLFKDPRHLLFWVVFSWIVMCEFLS